MAFGALRRFLLPIFPFSVSFVKYVSAGIEDENVYAALVRCDGKVELITEAIEEIVCETFTGHHVEFVLPLEMRLVDDRAAESTFQNGAKKIDSAFGGNA